jgi:hypothetical protein
MKMASYGHAFSHSRQPVQFFSMTETMPRKLDVAVLVEDGVGGADHAAGAAVDAELRCDDVQDLAVTRDGVGRAALHASGTADAGLDDPKGHIGPSINTGPLRHPPL